MANGATNPGDEDLRSRYSAETAPDYLANAAATNLAVADVGISKFNAVSRMNSSPGVGALGSTPQTDATNLSVAAAMDRGDAFDRGITSSSTTTSPSLSDAHADDIMARRDAIESQRRQVMINLGMIPPDPGTAVVLPSTDRQGQARRKEMLQNLAGLEDESNNLLKEHQDLTTFTAKQAHGNLVRQNAIQAANGKAKIFSGLADISQRYASDSPDFRLAVLNLFGSDDQDISAARGTSGFETLVRPFIGQHDKSVATAEAIKQARDNFTAGTGLEPESVELTASGGVNIRAGSTRARPNETTDVAKQLQQLHKITPNELLNPVSVRRGKIEDNKFTNSYDDAANGPAVQVDTGARTVTMSNSEYERFKSALQPSSASTTVRMKSPDGAVKDIPAGQVDHFKKLGATVTQ